jgi:hypothetical protein
MKTKVLSSIAAIALLGVSAGAGATVVDFGEISDGESTGASLFYSDPGTVIDDSWTFSLSSALFTAIVIDSADLVPFFAIEDLSAGSNSDLIEFTYDASDNQYEFSGLLAAGDYAISVGGVTGGSLGGQYQVSVGGTLTPIPLPPALWLMAGALFALRRTAKS